MRGGMWNFILREIHIWAILHSLKLLALYASLSNNTKMASLAERKLISDEVSDLQFSLIIEYYDDWKRMGLLPM